jgi:hypothetical protein
MAAIVSAGAPREFVRSKNIRFPSGRGQVPTWPSRD